MRNRYIVRGGGHLGKYIKFAANPTRSKKYSWTNQRYHADRLSYAQAVAIAHRYGGEVVSA